jgi:geranylgeranyl reductase family protein
LSEIKHVKVAIIGAGPAGSTLSMGLTKNEIEHVLIDKSTFPRDKICGDALSGKVVYALNRVKPDVVGQLTSNTKAFLPSWGISFIAPNGKQLDIPFTTDKTKEKQAPGFIATRADFDNLLVQNTPSPFCTSIFGKEVKSTHITPNKVFIEVEDGDSFTADMVVDCAGVRSDLAREFGIEMELNHYCAGLRRYYSGVTGLNKEGYIELHFIHDVLPGYFWIFPMTDGRVNVGLGMLSVNVSKHKVNLKKLLDKIITTHPEISKRFENAKPMESVKGWGLPLGSKKRQLSFDRLLFCGDSASIIDPFTGEGIGNAMLSAKYAADVIAAAIKGQDYSSTNLQTYTDQVYHHLWPELNMSHKLQKMVKYPWLFNFIANKGAKSKEFKILLTSMFENVDLRKKFRDPRFYFRLLFNR